MTEDRPTNDPVNPAPMLQWLFGTKPALQTRRTSAAGFKSEHDVKTLVSAGAMVTIYLIGMLVSNAVLPRQFGKLPEKAIAVVGFATPAVCFFSDDFRAGDHVPEQLYRPCHPAFHRWGRGGVFYTAKQRLGATSVAVA